MSIQPGCRRYRPQRIASGLLAAVCASLATAAAAETVALDSDVAWQQERMRIADAVDAELAGDMPTPARGDITQIHGMVRTAIVNGDYADLPAQGATYGPEFGYSVAIEGDWLAVGAPGTISASEEHGAREHGAVFVFRKSSGGWQLRQRLILAGHGVPRCGHSVAISLPHLAAGCPGQALGDMDIQGGVINLWTLNDNTQMFSNRVSMFPPAGEMHCGRGLALSRNYLAIGCPSADNGAGQVRLRRRNPANATWNGAIHETTLHGTDVAVGTAYAFGAAVALHEPGTVFVGPGNVRLAVGAPSSVYPGSIWPRGSVHLYHRALNDPNWNTNVSLRLATSGQAGNELAAFGSALAMNRNQLVVGAPNNRYGGIQTLPGPGSVHRYELHNVFGTVYEWQARESGGGVNVPDGPHAEMRFGAAVAIGHGNLVAIAAPGTSGHYANGGSADAVGMVETRRTASGDWSVFNYAGELRPGPLNAITRPDGQFGHGLATDSIRRRLAAGYPHSGTTLVGPGEPSRPRGAVWIYESDAIFADGFQ